MPQPSRAAVFSHFASIYIVWGSTYLAILFAIRSIPPLIMAGTRFLLAGAILYIAARLSGAKRTR
ncbi:MAG TPA: EamA family transporter, partial [Chthoniobacterales bacterium]|nr:EamA family transporter [Chthoniobacterales bacterium]